MDSLANRYSSALLSIAKEENKVIEYQNAVKVIIQCFKENPDIVRILSSSFVKYDEKVSIITDIIGKFSLENLISFFKLLVDNKRFNSVMAILKDFNSLCNDEQGIMEGIAYTVLPLTDDQLSGLQKAISKKMNKNVELKNVIDSSILGGVKVVINDTVFDGSILNKVESMKTSLLKGGLD